MNSVDTKRSHTLTFRFPFYTHYTDDEAEVVREQRVLALLSKFSFVRNVHVNRDNLREPLYVEVFCHDRKLQGKTVQQIENALSNILAKVYDFHKCL